MKRWYYVDVTTVCHERVAMKAEDEEDAKDMVETLVDAGEINPADASAMAYGSIDDSIVVAEPEYKRPPKGMRRFDSVC